MDNNSLIIRVGADITQFSRSMRQAQSTLNDFANANKATFDSFKLVGAAITGTGVAIAGGLALSVKEAASFQSAFAGVRKTVDASESEFAVLEKGIRDMAKILPASANEIAGVAEAAGQLGIKKENILAFSRTMVDLGESTNLTADQAATAFARFANITQMPQTEFDKLGSVVVALGNSMATTESEIVDMGMRLAAQGKQVGMTESQIMALAGTMSSLGIEAEAGGSAMTTVLKKVQSAVMTGGKFLDKFAEAAGTNAKDFAAAWNDDPIVALDMFTKGLSDSSAAGGNLAETLAFLGIKGIREQDVLLRMAGASDLLSEAVGTTSKAWEENSALSNEAAQRYETFESKLEMFKNVIRDVAISVGNVLLPAVTSLVEKLSSFAGMFSELNPKLIENAVVFTAVAGAVGLVVGPFLMLVGFLPSILNGFLALKTVFLALTGPIGLTVMAILAIGAGLVLAYNKVEWFRDIVDAAWADIKAATNATFQAIKQVVTNLITATVDVAKKLLDNLKAFWATNGEGILQKAKSTFETVKTTLSNIITDVVSFVKTQLDKFKAFWDENGSAIMALVKASFGQIKKDIEVAMGIIKGIFEVVWPIIAGVTKVVWNTIKLTIGNAIDLVLGIIQTVMKLIQGDWKGAWETIKTIAEKIVGNIVEFFKGVDLLQVGKDIISGLIKGIGSMAGAVKTKITEMANAMPEWIKDILGIHSPSRVMAELGVFVGQGLANGVASTKGLVTAAITGLGNVIKSVTKSNNAEILAIAKAQSAEEKAVMTKKTRDIANIHAIAKSNKRKLTVSESQRLAKIETDSAAKLTAIQRKYGADIAKIEADTAKEKLAAIKTFVEDKKSLEQLSLVAETEVWRKSIALFQVGTKERVDAQKAYQASLKAVNDEVVKVNEEYAGKMTAINDRLRKDEEDLTTLYTKSLGDRMSSLMSFAGLFDEFDVKVEKSGTDLLSNLKAQVDGFKLWQTEIEKLAGKAIDDGLIAELREMGPKALPELLALNSLTGVQLTEYSKLYQEKSKLARTQAEAELIGMKTDTAKRITELRAVANTELETLRAEWTTKIQAVTKATDDELKSLKDIGKNAAQGLLNGLASMEPALVSKARSIAESVKKAMAGAFDIHSPSRWMRDFIGVNMMTGWIDGMSSMRGNVLAMAGNATSWMTPEVPQVAGYSVPRNAAGLSRSVHTSELSPGATEYNSYTNHITIDAKNVTDFTNVVDFMDDLQQQVRKR